MIAIICLILASFVYGQNCPDIQMCKSKCASQNDSVKTCQAMMMGGQCITNTVCMCAGFFSQCGPKCEGKGFSSCTCSMGEVTAKCNGDATGGGSNTGGGGGGGLDGGAIAGIVIGVILYIACLGGLAFLWTRLPDADDEDTYEPNVEANNRESSTNSSPPARSKYDLDDKYANTSSSSTPMKEPTQQSYASKPPSSSYGKSPDSGRDTFGSSTSGNYGKTPQNPAATRGGRNDTSSGMDDADKMLDDILAESGTDRGYSSVAPSSQQAKYVTPGMMASAVDGDSYFMNFDDVKGINDDNYGKLPAKPDPNDAKKRAAEAARQRAAQAIAQREANRSAAGQSAGGGGGGGGGEDDEDELKKRRQEILRKKKEELQAKKAAAAAAAGGGDDYYQQLPMGR